jgi:hypothetical protein
MEQIPSRESVTQLVKKLPVICRTLRFITVSQGLGTGPYPESDVSSSHLSTLFS